MCNNSISTPVSCANTAANIVNISCRFDEIILILRYKR